MHFVSIRVSLDNLESIKEVLDSWDFEARWKSLDASEEVLVIIKMRDGGGSLMKQMALMTQLNNLGAQESTMVNSVEFWSANQDFESLIEAK